MYGSSSHTFCGYESVNCNLCTQYKNLRFFGRWSFELGCFGVDWHIIG